MFFLSDKQWQSVFFFNIFEFSALLSVVLDNKWELSSAFLILDRRLLTVQKLSGLHPCSSVTANVIAPLSPVLKVSTPKSLIMWLSSTAPALEESPDSQLGYSMYQEFVKAVIWPAYNQETCFILIVSLYV